jgi:hypothetical protein
MHVITSDSFHSIHRWWTDAWKDWPRILKRWYWWTWIFVQYSTWGSYSDTQILVLPKLFLHCQSTQHLHTRYCSSMSISGKIKFFCQEQFIKFQKLPWNFADVNSRQILYTWREIWYLLLVSLYLLWQFRLVQFDLRQTLALSTVKWGSSVLGGFNKVEKFMRAEISIQIWNTNWFRTSLNKTDDN